MMKILSTTLLLLTTFGAGSTQAANASHGATLHNEQCLTCHASRLGFGNNGNDIYTRTNHRVTSLDRLQQQVNRCKNNLQIVWFDEDVADVVEYLNDNFYHFEVK